MTGQILSSATDIADWLRPRVGAGEGLRRPYRRRWQESGRMPTHSFGSWPSHRIRDLGDALISSGVPIEAMEFGVVARLPGQSVWITANRGHHEEGEPDAYGVRRTPVEHPAYVGDTPEVIGQLVGLLARPNQVEDPATWFDQLDPGVQIGFPGSKPVPTYVGSWQWDIHGEAWDEEMIRLAAEATLAAIRAGGPHLWTANPNSVQRWI